LEQADQSLNVYEGISNVKLEEKDWPLYKSAILGYSIPTTLLTLESKANGARASVEATSWPIRDKGGFGSHIGGIISLRDVTAERKRQKRDAEMQGDMQIRQVIETMLPQLVWEADPSGFFNWYSKSFYDYADTTPQQLLGTGWQSIVHQDDLEAVGRDWSHSLSTGQLLETSLRLRRNDGQYRWFLARGMPVRDVDSGQILRWYGTSTDVHNQVEAHAASRRLHDQLQTVIDHAAITLWALNCEGHITIAEGPGLRQLRLTSENKSQVDLDVNSQVKGDKQCSTDSSSAEVESIIGRSIYDIWPADEVRNSISKASRGNSDWRNGD
jgi:PAS domain S-box-containing protein